jgi:phosphoglycerol transferase
MAEHDSAIASAQNNQTIVRMQSHEFASFLKHSFLEIAKKEWLIWLAGAALSFMAASLFMSGWPDGLLPDIQRPFTYAGDGISYMWNIKRVIEEAWFFSNSHTGYPFGSNHLDYPTSDTGSYAILKLVGTVFQSPVAALNLYFLLGFSFVFAASYIVLRTIDVSKIFALVGAALYAFATFHFARIGHLFFTWYFVAPIFFYYGFKLFNAPLSYQKIGAPYAFMWQDLLALVAISSFGIYYSVFGFIVLFVSTVLAALLYKSWVHFRVGCLCCAGVALGVFLNIAPSLWYLQVNGPNLEGVNRLPAESELYGLKLVQMLIPSADHRLDSFYDIAARYNNSFPLVTENISASFGAANSLGLLLLILSVFVAPMFAFDRTNRVKNKQYIYQFMVMGLLACSLYMIATVGGFSSLFALLVSASIRSWNRVSIFIEFISVAALVLSLDWFFGSSVIQKIKQKKYQLTLQIIIAALVVGYGIADETVKPCRNCLISNAQLFEHDKAFVQKVEKSLPSGSAIYQLPYMGYPEYNAVNNLGSYDQARGHLHSNTLKWSFGGIRGRSGDWFYRKLAHLPFDQQIDVAEALGFAGIYIDRRGYLSSPDEKQCAKYANDKVGRAKHDCLTIKEVEADIAEVLGEHADAGKIVSGDKNLVFIPLYHDHPTGLTGKADIAAEKTEDLAEANAHLLKNGFEIKDGIPVYAGGFDEAIDFRDNEFPVFVTGVTGLAEIAENGSAPIGSAARVTGRWSDAYVAPVVKLWLAKPLPAKFNLTITARGGGPNADKPLQIKIGKQVKELNFGAEMQTKTIPFELDGKFQTIEFKPYQPFVPARRWAGASDVRKLGVEFEKVLISAK